MLIERHNPSLITTISQRLDSLAGRSLRRDTAWTTASLVAQALTQALMMVSIVRLTGITEYGRYVYAAAVAGPFALLGGLKLRSVVATDMVGELPHQAYRIVGWIGAFGTGTLVTLLSLVPAVSRGAGLTMILVAASRILDGVSEVEYGLLQRVGRFRASAILLIVNSLLTCIAVAITLVAGGRLEAALLASAAASAVTYAAAGAVVNRGYCVIQRTRPFEPGVILRHTFRLLPLGASNAISLVRHSIPRVALEWTVGREAAGGFVAAYNLLAVAGIPVSALGVAAAPRLARLHSEQDGPGFMTLLRRFATIGAVLGLMLVIGTLAMGQRALSWVYGEEFWISPVVTALIGVAIGAGFVFMFFGSALNAMRLFIPQLRIALAVIVISTGLSTVLIPPLGLLGGGITLVGVALIECVLYVIVMVGQGVTTVASWPDASGGAGKWALRVVLGDSARSGAGHRVADERNGGMPGVNHGPKARDE